jgi:1-acyl-sn-glycerol-3-phosphate acyltransferase
LVINKRIIKKVLSILPSSLYYLFFCLLLGVFQLIQIVCYYIGGYGPHRQSVIVLNRLLMLNLGWIGTSSHFQGLDKIPKGRALIVVSNHQNMLDIPPLIWGFRHHHPKFISKKELGKGIPSISFNLKNGGSLLIDRKSGTTAVKQIFNHGKLMQQNKHAVIIFPEGTRSKNAALNEFKLGGIKALVQSMPEAVLIPFIIHDNFKVFQSGGFPLEIGHQLRYSVLDPIDPNDYQIETIHVFLEDLFKKALHSS